MTTAKARPRRRRRQDKPPVPANLVLGDHLKGDVGILSEDLFAELFPQTSSPSATASAFYVAITPSIPGAMPTTASWSLVPVLRAPSTRPVPSRTATFSPTSSALQSFALHLQEVAPSRLTPQASRHGIEILVLDAVPLPLSSVYVNLEGDLAKRLENGEGTFFRDRPQPGQARTLNASAASPDDKLAVAVRIALGSLAVVHDGDLFPLPLPPHPITHVPPNPGRIVLCEPVAQGVLAESTRIVVVTGRGPAKGTRSASLGPARLNGVKEDDEGMSTATEFYSATEEEGGLVGAATTEEPVEITEAEEEEETETSGTENDVVVDDDDDDDLSDDSMDDLISLEMPSLPATGASGVSTVEPGTPLGMARGRKTNGAGTPGSVFSAFTATTALPDRPRGRLFRAQGLLRPLPADLLHPRPAAEDDEEARIYVDITSLPKIGCFSGDWVRVEAAEEPPANGFGAFGLGSLASALESEPAYWRPARVYGLPQGYAAPRPVTRIPGSKSSKSQGRRPSFFESHMQRPTSPTAYASPLFVANLDSTPYFRLSPLKRSHYHSRGGGAAKLNAASRPPYAREITIHPVRSQLSVDRAYQTAVLGGLKKYFAGKVRLVRAGDLVAVPVDARLGQAMQEGPGAVTGSEVDDVMALASSEHGGRADAVAWFKIGQVQAPKADGDEGGSGSDDPWASVVCFDTASVRMNVSGSERSRIPGTRDSSWPYYLDLRKPPPKRAPDSPAAPALPEPEPYRQYVSAVRRQLGDLFAAATSPRAIGLNMPPVAVLLTSTHRGVGKATTALDACADVGLHAYAIDAHDVVAESEGGGTDVKTHGLLKARSDRAVACGPDCSALVLRHVDGLPAGERTAATLGEMLDEARVLVATANEVDKLSDQVRSLFTHELEVGAPDEAEREAILRSVLDGRGVALDPAVELGSVALKTAALVAADLVDVVDRALVAKRARLELLAAGHPVTVRDVQLAGGTAVLSLTRADLDLAVDAARKNFSDAIGAPKIPNVSWDDVGGLGAVKEAVTETIQLPLERPELFARGLRKRSGLLFYGPPGTGKTLLAKAIATEYSLNFFSVKGPELLNMYVGESEANVRRVFARARDARPCVVFFDELDSVAPKRGNQGDSGGVMDRIVSQLLAELDGMSGGGEGGGGGGGVFVVGATNRPDLLDPALLRPGRFDKMLYLGVSDTHEKQVKILEALTRKFEMHPSVSLTTIANRLPLTYTGADFYALCSDAMLKAVTRQAAAVDAKVRAINADRAAGLQASAAAATTAPPGAGGKLPPLSIAAFFDHFAEPEDVAVLVTETDFTAAQRELVPSVSVTELAHYERVRASFEGARQRGEPGTGSGEAPHQPPHQHHQQLLVAKRRAQSRSQSRGTGKAVSVSDSYSSRGKGKGKAVEPVGESGDEEDEEDEGEGAAAAARRRAKGKGRAAVGGSEAGTASDDEGLYEG